MMHIERMFEELLRIGRQSMPTAWDNDARQIAATYLQMHPGATAAEVAKFASTFATELAKQRPAEEPLRVAMTEPWS